jgi:hypothetical protein
MSIPIASSGEFGAVSLFEKRQSNQPLDILLILNIVSRP